MRPREPERSRVIALDDLPAFSECASTLTLSVPARPEALGIVRLVVMSCGAVAGLALEEIFGRSHEVARAFADVLVTQPEATSVVIRTQTRARDVDLVAIREPEVRPEA
jgi:hypothetical protein